MSLKIAHRLLKQIHQHGEAAYPEEGAGLLLGIVEGERRQVHEILPLENARENSARHNRYLITPKDMLFAEQEAMRKGLDVIGVFHSHPDHPNHPSDFDRQWALPWFSYMITSVNAGKAVESCCWRLAEDRQSFFEERIVLSIA